MRRSRFSDEQIMAMLKENEAGAKVDYVCRRHGVSEAMFYAWRAPSFSALMAVLLEFLTTMTAPVLEPLAGSAPALTATTQQEISSFARP